MKGFNQNERVKEYLDEFDEKQSKGFNVVLSLLKEYFPKIDCWARNVDSSIKARICFGVKALDLQKGRPVFCLTNGNTDKPIVFRMTGEANNVYEGIENAYGAGWNRTSLKSNLYHFVLKDIAVDSSSLREFLDKISKVAAVTKITNGKSHVPDDYPNENSPEIDTASSYKADEKVWQLIMQRRGQGEFRQLLLKKYKDTCAISGCKAIDALEAAHITPHSDGGKGISENGLLLRADIHTLYDLNLIGVDQEGVVHVSPKLEDDLYQGLNGSRIKDTDSSVFRDNLGKRFRKYHENQKL
jgi:hypothetical protein